MAIQPVLSLNESGGAVPFAIRLAPSEDIHLSSVTAEWDGSGASGTFLACLSLYSQAGVLLSRSFPSQQFAAGDTGVVTYAPPLGASGSAGSGSGGSGEWARVRRTTTVSVPATSSILVPWTNFITSDGDGAVFGTGTEANPDVVSNTSGDVSLICLAAGVVHVSMEAQFSTITTVGYAAVETSGVSTPGGIHVNDNWASVITAPGPGTSGWLEYNMVIAVPTPPSYLVVRAFNGDGVARNLAKCTVMAGYVAVDPDAGTVTVY